MKVGAISHYRRWGFKYHGHGWHTASLLCIYNKAFVIIFFFFFFLLSFHSTVLLLPVLFSNTVVVCSKFPLYTLVPMFMCVCVFSFACVVKICVATSSARLPLHTIEITCVYSLMYGTAIDTSSTLSLFEHVHSLFVFSLKSTLFGQYMWAFPPELNKLL